MKTPSYQRNLLVVDDRVASTLVSRGFLASHWARERVRPGLFGVTPDGLRALADAMERGELEQFMDPKYERDRVRLYMSQKQTSLNRGNGKSDD